MQDADGLHYVVTQDGAVLTGYTGESGRLELPDGFVAIGAGALADNDRLTYVRLPGTVISIGAEAFRGCTSLQTIDIPDTVAHIGAAAFAECRSLTSLTLTGPIRMIETDTFRRCSRLRKLTLSDSLNRVADHAFDGCIRLEAFHVYAADPEHFARFCALFDTYQGYNAETGERGAILKSLEKVHVNAPLPEIRLDPESCILSPGAVLRLSVVCQSEKARSLPSITWNSSDTDVALVYDGLVVAVRAGVCRIEAAAPDGRSATCEVRVAEAPTVRSTTTSVTASQRIQTDPPSTTDTIFPTRLSTTTANRTPFSPPIPPSATTVSVPATAAATGDPFPYLALLCAILCAAILLMRRQPQND